MKTIFLGSGMLLSFVFFAIRVTMVVFVALRQRLGFFRPFVADSGREPLNVDAFHDISSTFTITHLLNAGVP